MTKADPAAIDPAPIVVGIDGSSESRAALRFVLNEGNLRGSGVEVVTAWEPSSMPDPVGVSVDAWREDAQRIQDKQMTSVLAEYGRAPVVSRRIVLGGAGPVLVSASRDAAFLVVGTERKGVARRIALGSVSEYCVRHATCPVVVVPAEDAAAPHNPVQQVIA
jgi:nucleotide-binding universal stress UspA family protein